MYKVKINNMIKYTKTKSALKQNNTYNVQNALHNQSKSYKISGINGTSKSFVDGWFFLLCIHTHMKKLPQMKALQYPCLYYGWVEIQTHFLNNTRISYVGNSEALFLFFYLILNNKFFDCFFWFFNFSFFFFYRFTWLLLRVCLFHWS